MLKEFLQLSLVTKKCESRPKIALFFKWAPFWNLISKKRKQLRSSEVKYLNCTKNSNSNNNNNFACDNYIFLKTRGNRNKQWTHSTPLNSHKSNRGYLQTRRTWWLRNCPSLFIAMENLKITCQNNDCGVQLLFLTCHAVGPGFKLGPSGCAARTFFSLPLLDWDTFITPSPHKAAQPPISVRVKQPVSTALYVAIALAFSCI